jgi:hypothetical protein
MMHRVSEKLRLSLAYAYEQWCRGVLARRAAQDAESKLKGSYEKILQQSREVQAAIESIEADEAAESANVTPE